MSKLETLDMKVEEYHDEVVAPSNKSYDEAVAYLGKLTNMAKFDEKFSYYILDSVVKNSVVRTDNEKRTISFSKCVDADVIKSVRYIVDTEIRGN